MIRYHRKEKPKFKKKSKVIIKKATLKNHVETEE